MASDNARGKVSVHELRALSVAARQPDTVCVEHFLGKVRSAVRIAATRGDYATVYTIPLIEGGMALYDPVDMARKVGVAILKDDKKLRVSVLRNTLRVSWHP